MVNSTAITNSIKDAVLKFVPAKSFYLFPLVVILAIGAAAGCARHRYHGTTIEEGFLTVGVEVGYPPMEYLDTDGVTLAGFDIELTKALADKLGLQARYIDTAWEGILAGLDTRRYDIAVNITILPERRRRYNFTRPYIDSSLTMVTRKDAPVKIDEPKDIAGRRAAYQSETTAQYFTEQLAREGVDFSPFAYDKILNCFDDLALGRVDVVVADNLAAFDYAGKENSPFTVAWQGPSNEVIGICLKKGDDALTAALDKALADLFTEGTLAALSEKTFKRDMVSAVFLQPQEALLLDDFTQNP